jgi:hypothetical protein
MTTPHYVTTQDRRDLFAAAATDEDIEHCLQYIDREDERGNAYTHIERRILARRYFAYKMETVKGEWK